MLYAALLVLSLVWPRHSTMIFEPPCVGQCAKAVPAPDMSSWSTKQYNITSIFARNLLTCTMECDRRYTTMFNKEEKLQAILKDLAYEGYNISSDN